jgi:branched-chain amino acid transport system permease protein
MQRWKIGWLAALIIGLSIMPFLARPYVVEVAMLFFIYIILAQSYRLIVTAHDWQLYHVVVYGVGAYTSGLLSKYFGIPIWVTIPIGGAMASLVAAGITRPLLRTRGWGFYIATYGLAELIRLVWVKFHTPFGGPRGIIDIPYGPVVAGVDFSHAIPYYFFTMGVMFACLYLMYRIDRSRMGDAFKALSIDPQLAESIGIRVPHQRLLAAAIGGFFAGIAGGLFVHRLGAVDPNLFNIITMLYLLIWVVVGGYQTFWGPIIGVAVMQAVFEVSRPLLQVRPLIFGITLILVLVLLPGGLESAVGKAVARFRQRRRTARAAIS